MNRILSFAVACMIAAGLSSCGMHSLRIQVVKPAEITIPQHIQKVAIANRSFPSKKQKVENILEGIITGEGIGMDREGSEECVAGLVEILRDYPRYTAVNAGVELEGTGREAFPPVLDWEEVKRLCQANGADGLLLLEVFDSDASVDISLQDEKYKDKEGVEHVRTVTVANTDVKVTTGWRFYDASSMQIVDEFKAIGTKSWSAKGIDEKDARHRLPSRRETVKSCGYIAGNIYAARISPVNLWVTRSYYVRKHPGLKAGATYANAQNWDAAATEWKKVLIDGDNKQKGRAAYNLAVASEVKGNLENALSWAQKAAGEYGNGNANAYISILKQRMYDQQRLKEQTGGNQ